MPADNAKRIRRRSKSGCLTCRVRKIKCDEAHPVCSRCEKIGRACAYPAPKEQRPRPSGRQKPDAARKPSVSVPGCGEAAALGAQWSPAIGSVEVLERQTFSPPPNPPHGYGASPPLCATPPPADAPAAFSPLALSNPSVEPAPQPWEECRQFPIDPLLDLSTAVSDSLGPKVLAKLPDFIKAYADILKAVDESGPMAADTLARILLEGPLEHAIRRQVRVTGDRSDSMSVPLLVNNMSTRAPPRRP